MIDDELSLVDEKGSMWIPFRETCQSCSPPGVQTRGAARKKKFSSYVRGSRALEKVRQQFRFIAFPCFKHLVCFLSVACCFYVVHLWKRCVPVCTLPWITTLLSLLSPSTRVRFYASPCNFQACRRQLSWDRSHMSEIYPPWSFDTREGHRHTTHSQRILLGLVAWQRWLIGLAGLRKGLARAEGIRSLPLIILSLCAPLRAEAAAAKSKPCLHVWEGVITHTLTDTHRGKQTKPGQVLCTLTAKYPKSQTVICCSDCFSKCDQHYLLISYQISWNMGNHLMILCWIWLELSY